MNKMIRKEIEFAGRKLILESGELAMRAPVAVKATYGDTVVLLTISYTQSVAEIDYLDLRIEYQEKMYASGSINSSRYIKRDGKATDNAVIARRVIDHAFRPLFAKDLTLSVQIVATVLSLDENADPEFLAMVATAAAVYSSELPAKGPVGTARVGLINDKFVLCPSLEELHENSDLEMMISFVGDDKRFLAVEAGANILPEDKILGAIHFARENMDPLMNLIKDFGNEMNPTRKVVSYTPKISSEDLVHEIKDKYQTEMYTIVSAGMDLAERSEKSLTLKRKVIQEYSEKYKQAEILEIMDKIEKEAIRKLALVDGKRLDGRAMDAIRPISVKVGVLPRTHGSGLFTRGTTQALTTATLGSPSQELLIQDMYGERSKRFLHFYNFPPYSTGEVGRFGTPGGREIGHGMIAEKSLKAVMPSRKEFPYTTVLVSEILSSNGSSSMAATCGATLALMDAGVPIKGMVGGVAMGLIVEDEETFAKYHILTDLPGEEDFAGYLDFKMTGTTEGVTAIQCDMKVKGLPMDVLEEVIWKSREGRLFVLKEMSKVITAPKETMSQYAPKMLQIQIDPDKIGAVIGSGGKVIKEIQETTGTDITIEEDGNVLITGNDLKLVQQAHDWVDGITRDIKPGEIYDGTVVDLLDFGALVEILPGKVGLLHISELSNEYIKDIRTKVKVGDAFKVKVLRVEDNGKIALSKKSITA